VPRSGMLQVSVNVDGLVPAILLVERKVLDSARKAGSSALRAMKSEASKRIRQDRPLKVKWVNRLLFVRIPKKGGELVWHLGAAPAPVPAIAFPTRQTKAGVSVEVNRGRRTLIKGGFLATMKSGHKGVFIRDGKKRLPISEEYTGRISELFAEASPLVQARGVEVFRSTFQRLMLAAGQRKVSDWERDGEHD
jgi:hypothetical protein